MNVILNSAWCTFQSEFPHACGVAGLLKIHFSVEQLQIWDTAGQERFRTITQSYYRSTNGAIITYDITKKATFMAVPKWMEDVKKYGGSNIATLLIGQ